MKYYLNEKYLDGMKIDVTGLAQVFKWKLVTSQTGRILADFQTHVSQLFETASQPPPQKLWQWQFSVYFHTRKENMITKSYFTVIIMIIG